MSYYFTTPRLSPDVLRFRENSARTRSAVLLDLYAPLVHKKERVRELRHTARWHRA